MKIKNWSKFQHFKDRKPPWVKLYRDVLDDLEWHELDPLASKVLVMCWLIASEDEGRLPNTKTLAFRLRMTEKQTLESINKLSHWLEQDDIDLISEQYQTDSLETERETETKKEKKATIVACPPDVSESVWSDWLQLRKAKKAPVTQTVVNSAAKEAEKAGISLNAFLTIWCARGSQGLQAEWLKTNERQTFANKHDVAHVTTPTPANHDAALRKIEEDRKKAVPIPPEIKAKMEALRRGAV
jgi:hypothetical protein